MAKQFSELNLVEKKSLVQTLLEGKPYPHVKHLIDTTSLKPQNCRVTSSLSDRSPSSFYQLVLELDSEDSRKPFAFLDFEHNMCIMMYSYNLLDLLNCDGDVVVKDGEHHKRSEFSRNCTYDWRKPIYKILPLDVNIHTAPVPTATYSKRLPYTLEELMAIEKVKLPAFAPEKLLKFVDGIKCFMDCLFVLFCEKEGYEDPHLDCLSVAQEKPLVCALTGQVDSVKNLIEKKNVDFCNNQVFRDYVLAKYTQISDQKSEKMSQRFSNPLTPISQPVPDLKSEKMSQRFSNPLTPTSQPVPDSSYMESQDRQMLPPQRQTLYPSLYDAPGYHQMSATHMSQAPGYHQMFSPQMSQAPGYHQISSDGQPIYSPFVPQTSGFHQTSSPFGQQASGFYQISSPFGQQASPVQPHASYAQQMSSPSQQMSSPVQQMSSPFGQHASHAQQSFALPQQMSSPFGQQASPVQPHASPFGQQASPVQPHASYVQQMSSPFGQQASPVQPQTSHAQQMSSPSQQRASMPQQGFALPQQMSSPSQQGFALPQQNSSCHQEEANLFKELFPHQILSKASKMQQSTQAVDWSPFDRKFSPDLCLKKDPTTQMLQEKSPFWQDKASLLPQMSTPCVPQSSPVSKEASPLLQMSTPCVPQSSPVSEKASPLPPMPTPCVPQPPPLPPMPTPYVPQASPVQNTSSLLQKLSSILQKESSCHQENLSCHQENLSCHQEPVSSPRLSSDIFQTSRGKKPVEDSESEDDDNTSEESFCTVIAAPTMSQKNKSIPWSEQCDEQVEKIKREKQEKASSPQQQASLPQQMSTSSGQGFALPQQRASMPQQQASLPQQMETTPGKKASFHHQHLDEDLADPYTYQPMSCRCMEMFIREVQAFPVETAPKDKVYIYQAIKLLQDNKSNVPFRYVPRDKNGKILVALLATVLSGANSSCPQYYRFHQNQTITSFCKKLGIEKDPFVIFLHNSIVSLTVDVEQEVKDQFSFLQIFTLVLEKLNQFQKKVKTILDAFFPILETHSTFLKDVSAYREAESEYLEDMQLETSKLFHFVRIKKTGNDNKNIVPVYPLSAEKISPKKIKASVELKETRKLGMSHGNLKDAHQKYQLYLNESHKHQVWIRQQEASCRQQGFALQQQEASCRQQGFALQQQEASCRQQMATSSGQMATSSGQGFALPQQRASMLQQEASCRQQMTSRREQRASYHQEQASRYQMSSSPYYQDLSRYHQDLSNYHQEVTAKEQQPLRRKKQAPLPPQQASSSQQQVPPKEKQASSSQQQVPPKEEQASTSQEQAPLCEKPVAQKKPPGNQQTHLSTSKGSHPLFTGSHPAVPKKSVTSSGQPASPEETLVTSSSPQVSVASTSQQDVSSSSPVDPNP